MGETSVSPIKRGKPRLRLPGLSTLDQTCSSTPRIEVTGERLGERLRQLRIAAGLTQTELAGGRFSKEYMSQIERGKTRPTGETVRWLAERLGVDPSLLSGGMSSAERSRLEATVT